MKKISKFRKYLFLILFTINILFSKEDYTQFDIKINIENDLKHPFIKYSNKEWIPSLFCPILLAEKNFETLGFMEQGEATLLLKFIEKTSIKCNLFKSNSEKFGLYLGLDLSSSIENNLFGLSLGSDLIESGLKENQFNLAFLKDKTDIKYKIFSFDNWQLNEEKNFIESKLYIGDIHEHFNPGQEIIGSCKNIEENTYWGCLFDEMIFKDKNISLKNNKTNELYKIYFSSDSYDILFPNEFKGIMNNIDGCTFNEDEESYVCQDYLQKFDYIPLILRNEDMNITLEIDNVKRYHLNEDVKDINTKIQFKNNEYFIFPLIMFKNFHVQFDGEANIISFYTTNKDILEVKKKKEPNNNEDNSSSSTGLKIFLWILIILLIICIGFGVFFFIKKRKQSNVEKNINRFTKFEDEEDFQNMNEKKVY